MSAAFEGGVVGSVGSAGACGVDVEASVAMFADSYISVESLAIGIDFAADSIVVENVAE